MLTIRKISFRNIRGSRFPSRASLASPDWQLYQDMAEIPALVLMESINGESAQVVFLSMRNIDKLLSPADSETFMSPSSDSDIELQQVINSQVMHLAFGHRSDLMRMTEPVVVVFQHQRVNQVKNPQCVLWDKSTETWSSRFWDLVYSNKTHSECECSRVGTMALLEDVVRPDSMEHTTFMVMIIVAVSVSAIVIISVILIAVYCYRIKVDCIICFRVLKHCVLLLVSFHYSTSSKILQ